MANPNPKNQWKPGESGNPNGRPPKGYSITEWFKEFIASKEDDQIREAIGKKLLGKALEGDLAAIRLIWNYMDGMPPQDLTSKGEKIDGLAGLFAKANSEPPEED